MHKFSIILELDNAIASSCFVSLFRLVSIIELNFLLCVSVMLISDHHLNQPANDIKTGHVDTQHMGRVVKIELFSQSMFFFRNVRFLNTLCERHKAETELYSDHALANQADHIHCCQLKDTEKMKYVPETGSRLLSFFLIIKVFFVFFMKQ